MSSSEMESDSSDAEASVEPEKSKEDKPEGKQEKPEGDLDTIFELNPELKERPRKESCVIVRRLPNTLKKSELIAAMEKVGPVERAFIVTDKQNKESRGLGFVTFSSPDDAKRATKKIKFIAGKQIILHVAEHKERGPSKDEDVKAGKKRKLEKNEEKPTKVKKRVKYTGITSRLIMLTGLKPGITESRIRKAMTNYGIISLVIYPHPESSKWDIQAMVVFKSPASAQDFALKNKRPFQIGKLSVTCRHVEERLEGGRLKINNLSFEADEKDLEALFGKYGELTEVKIVKKPDGRSRGFAFVNFKKFLEAAKALQFCDKRPIRDRLIDVDWGVPKNRWEKLKRVFTEAKVARKLAKEKIASMRKLAKEKSASPQGTCKEPK